MFVILFSICWVPFSHNNDIKYGPIWMPPQYFFDSNNQLSIARSGWRYYKFDFKIWFVEMFTLHVVLGVAFICLKNRDTIKK